MNISLLDWFGYLIIILKGGWVTLYITFSACLLALAVAFIAGLMRLSSFKIISWLAIVYIEFFRGTSIFVQLFWAYFVLPLIGIPISPAWAGICALGLNVGSYGAEVVRGAILAVPRSQKEASTALNFTPWQTFRHVIFPQAIVLMLPTFSNNAIELLKGTAIVSLISLSDLTFQAQTIRQQTGHTAIPFISILIIYFIISTVISSVLLKVENKLGEGLDTIK